MKQHKTFMILIIALLHLSGAICQKKSALKDSFSLEISFYQNGSSFKFWRGSYNDTQNRILIERTKNKANTILFNDFVRDGIYKASDVNHDGFKDFILNYHDYDEIYFFDKKSNNFSYTPVTMPKCSGIIDSVRKIYWGYRDAQYAEHFDYSILYTYNNCKPYVYYKIIYKTARENEGKSDALKIELYKFEGGNYSKPVFVKELKTADPSKLDYKKYWKGNYKNLIAQR